MQGMLSTFKPAAEQALRPLAKVLKNVDPNIISLGGIIFPIVFFILLVSGLYALALVVFVLNAVDMLDGMVARSQGKVTAFGAFLDSTIDRFADFVVIAAFGFASLVSWPIVLTLILLTYLISYIRSRTELAAKNKLVANIGLIERTERLVVVFIGLLLYAIFPTATLLGVNIVALTFVLLIGLSAITVWQRVDFARRKLQPTGK